MRAENTTRLFTLSELLRFQAVLAYHKREASKAPALLLAALLSMTGALAVGFVEWEIVYRIFDYLAGDANKYWSPKLMACSSLIVIVGFHVLAKARPGNLAARLVDGLIGLLIPAYLLGTGLLIASILYADGLGALVTPEALPVFGAPTVPPPHGDTNTWLDRVFVGLTNPLAVVMFSIGIGGLAICNIFVSHQLLTIAETKAGQARLSLRQARAARADHQVIKRTQERYQRVSDELAELDRRWDEPHIREAIACEVLSAIAEALLPHKRWLAAHALQTSERFEQDNNADARPVAEQVARIESICRAEVMSALTPSIQGACS